MSALSATGRLLVVTATGLLALSLLAGCSSGSADTPAATSTAAEKGAPAKATEEPAKEAAAPAKLNAEGLLAGNATPADLPAGEPGKVSVVYTGPFNTASSTLPIVIRNSTDAAISHIDASATARTATGALIATGTSQGTSPAQVPPGGLTMGYIYFETAPPADATYEFSFETIEADTTSYNSASVQTVEAVRSGDSIVGTGKNTTGATLTGPYSVQLYCFDPAGQLAATTGTFANEDGEVAPDGTVSFTAALYDTSCESYLVGIGGWFA